MSLYKKAINEYLSSIHSKYAGEDTTEASLYPDLITLLKEFFPRNDGYEIISIPKKTTIGVPDIKIKLNEILVGYIECKKPTEDLKKIMQTKQLKRYSTSFPNLILTDFLDFWKIRDLTLEENVRIVDDIEGKTPPKGKNLDEFEKLINDFKSFEEPTIDTIDALTDRLSKLTKHLKELIIEDIKFYKSSYNIFLLEELKKYFVIEPEYEGSIIEFSDLFAQTIVYGLFLAWIKFKEDEGNIFNYQVCQTYFSNIHPFLNSLFQTIVLHQSQQIVELIFTIENVLNKIKYPDIFQDVEFEDFILNFYEVFIDAYDKSLKVDKGIFYTKFPIVNFIIKGIDNLLKSSLGIKEGILSKSIKYLDPAAGTLTFLSQLVKYVKNKFKENNQLGLFEGWVKEHFLVNVFAFEIMIAPYTLGHFKIKMVLEKLGYNFNNNERVQSFLTNTLQSIIPSSLDQTTLFESIGLADEFKKADEIKRKSPILVIMGNPPYKKLSHNNSDWIAQLMKDYRFSVPEKWKKSMISLNDDYIKFIRFSQWKIEELGEGLVSFITNNTFLDGLIFTGMRKVLFNVFDELYVINLNGAMRRAIPDIVKANGINKDESVFDISLGTCIFFFLKKKKSSENQEDNIKKYIKYIDVWGGRLNASNPNDPQTKFGWLNTSDLSKINWIELKPKEPYYFFIPYEFEFQAEYEDFIPMDEIFDKFQVGITTARDSLVLDFTKEELIKKIRMFADEKFNQLKKSNVILKDYTSTKWTYKGAAKTIALNKKLKKPEQYVYRGFDKRYIYYDKSVIHRISVDIMKLMKIPNNMAILTTKQLIEPPFNHVFITENLTDIISLSTKSKENAFLFPLIFSIEKSEKEKERIIPNIKPAFIEEFKKKYGLEIKQFDLAKKIFYYIYAILHSSIYRQRYEKGLMKDFPSIPFVSNKEYFLKLSEKGQVLTDIHLFRSNNLNSNKYPFNSGSNLIQKVEYNSSEQKLYINEEQFFGNISLEMWEFRVGTILPIEDWLNRRLNRKLTNDDATYFLTMLDAIKLTIETIKEIDSIYREILPS